MAPQAMEPMKIGVKNTFIDVVVDDNDDALPPAAAAQRAATAPQPGAFASAVQILRLAPLKGVITLSQKYLAASTSSGQSTGCNSLADEDSAARKESEAASAEGLQTGEAWNILTEEQHVDYDTSPMYLQPLIALPNLLVPNLGGMGNGDMGCIGGMGGAMPLPTSISDHVDCGMWTSGQSQLAPIQDFSGMPWMPWSPPWYTFVGNEVFSQPEDNMPSRPQREVGVKVEAQADGRQVVYWTLKKEQLESTSKSVTHPGNFDLALGPSRKPVPFKMQINAVCADNTKGKNCMKMSKNRGWVQVKCQTVLDAPVEVSYKMTIGLGDKQMPYRGPVLFEFSSDSNVSSLPVEEREFDFGQVVEEGTFTVCLEITA
eukprot:TRINITY_DN75424_c0_g1_i1.p1 TRINITY_DN75424_c0_g1~~TRINITY_DN75424_c0_g1_i1.p1  ORF type:complete len:373 (+),score=61.58 TRINITY_DN75424_c0_g1_i1:67-1185(+)